MPSILNGIIGFATQNILYIGAALAFSAVVLSWRSDLIEKGQNKAKAKIEKANATATKVGRASANSSGKPGTSGVRSPRYRN